MRSIAQFALVVSFAARDEERPPEAVSGFVKGTEGAPTPDPEVVVPEVTQGQAFAVDGFPSEGRGYLNCRRNAPPQRFAHGRALRAFDSGLPVGARNLSTGDDVVLRESPPG
jgi:hypothetical protein